MAQQTEPHQGLLMAPDEDVVGFRLRVLEGSVTELREHVDKRLDAIHATVGNLAYVSRDVYVSERDTMRDFNKETRNIAESSRSIAMWALGLVAATAIAAIIGLLRSTVG